MADWKRPAGPLNVWRQLEADERLAGGTTRRVRFSIQDVPEDRYDEAIEHMVEFFLADEATCASLSESIRCTDFYDDAFAFLRLCIYSFVSRFSFRFLKKM